MIGSRILAQPAQINSETGTLTMVGTDMTAPLAGIKIADFTQLMQGPLCTQLLADLGADVVKIERPHIGEIGRHSSPDFVGEHSAFFAALNRNKRSIALDLKTKGGLAAAHRLIAEADVLVENFRPGTMDKLGLGYSSLHAAHPSLIYASASGFGSTGPFASRPGQDLLAQAVSGAMSLTGRADDPPTPAGMFIADAYAGMLLTVGIMTALFHRSVSGTGQRVDASLYAALVHLQSQELVTFLNTGRPPLRAAQAGHAYTDGPYGVYAARDGYLAISVAPLEKLGPLIGLDDLAEQFPGRDRFDRRDAMKVVIEEVLGEDNVDTWLHKLWAADIWCAPVMDYPRMAQSAQFQTSGLLVPVEGYPVGGIGLPIRLSELKCGEPRRPPFVGEHTAEVLASLRYSIREIDELLASGAAFGQERRSE